MKKILMELANDLCKWIKIEFAIIDTPENKMKFLEALKIYVAKDLPGGEGIAVTIVINALEATIKVPVVALPTANV